MRNIRGNLIRLFVNTRKIFITMTKQLNFLRSIARKIIQRNINRFKKR